MLETVDENIWIVEGDCVDFHGFPYPTRSVIVRLTTGDLWVWSPVALSDALKKAVDQIGTPRYLISPNKIHHLFLQEWSEAYPDAEMWGPDSTIEKRSDLSFTGTLTGDAPPQWRAEIDQVWFNGSPAMDEVVFFHRASKTVILADLSENFDREFMRKHWAWWQRRGARIWGIVRGRGYAPLDWRWSFFFGRKSTRRTRDDVFAWQPEKVIMAHGVWQRSNGLAYLRKSFSWM